MSPSPTRKEFGLPPGVSAWVERVSGAQLARCELRPGGGASREGAFVELRYEDGRVRLCYLTYDLRAEIQSDRLVGFAAEASAIAALQGTAVRVAGLVAYDETYRAMLTDRVQGEADFGALKIDDDRRLVAEDFMAQLAALHQLDVGRLQLKGFPELAPPSHYVHKRLAGLSAKHQAGSEDPLLVFALRWLADNVPADPPRTVLTHGDAGPANFLYQDCRVTALLDWEMTHFGDPMEDLAWIAIRMLFVDFQSLAECFAAYERASATLVDLQKVRYYCVYALASLAVDTYADLNQSTGVFQGVLGNYLVYFDCHTRALIERIAEFAEMTLPVLDLPEIDEGANSRSFDIALGELRTLIIPRIDDALAGHRAKALTRVIKYWKSLDRYKMRFDQMEVDETAVALGRSFDSLNHAREALVDAIRARSVDDAVVIRLLYLRIQRQAVIMAPALGPLANRPLSSLT